MGKVKGCINQECKASKKKTFFDKKNNFCPLCGKELVFVCKNKKCYTQLADNTKKPYCVRCLAERKEKTDKVVKTSSAAVGLVGAGIIGLAKILNPKDKL